MQRTAAGFGSEPVLVGVRGRSGMTRGLTPDEGGLRSQSAPSVERRVPSVLAQEDFAAEELCPLIDDPKPPIDRRLRSPSSATTIRAWCLALIQTGQPAVAPERSCSPSSTSLELRSLRSSEWWR